MGAVYLVHGTFAGTDALGLIRGVAQFIPGARALLERQAKRLVDAAIGETGNFAAQYATLFEQAIADSECEEARIPVRLVHWTSENHHAGRADAAVRVIDELNSLAATRPPGERVLLWGHSHAGNVLALVTNLLAADAASRDAFFDAARVFYRRPFSGNVDVPIWQRVYDALKQSDRPLDEMSLDIVTFGTPVRYGWDACGYAKLLHFVYHRPVEGLPPYQAPFPLKVQDLVRATYGDAIAQLGIAGTNVAPGMFAWRTWLANRRLADLVQAGIRKSALVRHLSCGMRVPDEGTTLLVDYRHAGGNLASRVAGHAVYTRREWLLFHAEEVCRHFYANAGASPVRAD